MSQNGQSYSRGELSRLLKMKEQDMMQGERGVIIERIERQHGKLDREVCDRWLRMGAPTPSSLAGPRAAWTTRRWRAPSSRGASKHENKPGRVHPLTAPVRLLCPGRHNHGPRRRECCGNSYRGPRRRG